MYTIHGFGMSFNTTKVLYVAEELGIDYEFVGLDLTKGEHKLPEHMARHPLGKTPTLDHDGKVLFESATICRYMAEVEQSPLYAHSDPYRRGQINQWIDYFSAHSGRWLSSLLFERVFKGMIGMGDPDQANIDEALGFLEPQMGAVDAQLGRGQYLAGDALSIADSFAFAYVETCAVSQFPLDPYPNIVRWNNEYAGRAAVQRAQSRAGTA